MTPLGQQYNINFESSCMVGKINVLFLFLGKKVLVSLVFCLVHALDRWVFLFNGLVGD